MANTLSRRTVLIGSTAIGTVSASVLSPIRAASAADQPGASTNGLTTVRALTEQGRWDEYSRERDPKADVIQAVDFTLNQNAAGGGADLIVICDRLTIDGLIKLPSKNILLAARKIISKNNGTVETSGDNAQGTSARAQDGRTPGAPGTNGAPGQGGASAGAVLVVAGQIHGGLTLRANGGDGAKGQQGGQGAVGQTGAVGTHATSQTRPGNGGPGGTGGKGGMGGPGGNGGDTGQITVLTLTAPANPVQVEAFGGTPGSVGNPGPGGDGGAGGAAGDNHFVNPPRHGPDGPSGGDIGWWDQGANPGPKGHHGDPGDANSAISSPGRSLAPISRTADINELAIEFPITQLAMTLSRAFISFANGEDEDHDLEDQLNWIQQIADAPQSGSKFFDDRAIRAGSPSVGRPSSGELHALAAQASILIDRLRLGLDVFGHVANYVSSLNAEYLIAATKKRFEIAQAIEAAHDKYLTDLSNIQQAAAHLKESLTYVKDSEDQLSKDQAEYNSQANQAQDDVQALSSTISELTQQLQAADQAFQDAIASKSNCSLGKMIEFVVGVIAICYGVYAGVMAIGDAMKTANSTSGSGNIIKDLEFVVETFDKSKVNEYFQKMQDGFNKVQDALKNDSKKLVVSLEAFESQLQPYLDMDEAKRYRDLMRQLVDVAKTRNEKLLAYSQFVLKSAEAKVQQTALSAEADRIAGLVAATNNPVLVDCVTYLTRYLASCKRGLVELLDLQRRSLIYTSLVPIKPSYNWTIVAELQQSQAKLDQALLDAADKRGREEQSLTAEFSIMRSANRPFFNSLQSKGRAAFSIPLDHPEFNRGGTAFVIVTEAAFLAEGLGTNTGEFTLRLTHQGNSIFRDEDGNLMNFSHRKRPTTLSYRKKGAGWEPIVSIDNNLGGSNQKYLYLSPFAGWTLENSGADKLDWRQVRQIKFSFKAQFIPSSILRPKRFSPQSIQMILQ